MDRGSTLDWVDRKCPFEVTWAGTYYLGVAGVLFKAKEQNSTNTKLGMKLEIRRKKREIQIFKKWTNITVSREL